MTGKAVRTALLTTCFTAPCFFLAPMAVAQEAPSAEEEIVVVARKQGETVLETPGNRLGGEQ